ncbi:MAG: hypothetical protein JRI39_14040, partial [Deltaproteobacteria bacterium]|nr:hypothetical protein [Deltaproteobacteria bacterium]
PNGNIRLGIPHLQAGEALHGVCLPKATCFPQAIALASTWDPELIERMANIIAKEARALGVHHVYSPMLGVVRDPRWGRTEESYGEDPYLVSRIGVAFIKGLQGTGKNLFDKNHIIATAVLCPLIIVSMASHAMPTSISWLISSKILTVLRVLLFLIIMIF